MSDARHERLTDLFARACDLPARERREFLDRECSGDPELRAELASLLALDRDSTRPDAEDPLADTVRLAMEETGARAPANIAEYRIERRLGTGGTGTVFEAVRRETGRRVALKVLHGPLLVTSKVRRRFEREAWVAGRLDHPNVVKVYEHGSWEGLDYIAMELIEGGSMQDVLEAMLRDGRDHRTGLEFESDAYLRWVVDQGARAARALDYAHRRGVVHRDVKPANLLLGGNPPEVRIADFGIALAEDATRFTTEGRIIGTLRYMAPEQLRAGREIDRRADVYALGVTLFALLTLDHPFRAETQEHFLHAVLHDEPRRIRSLNDRLGRDLQTVIDKTLQPEPRDRYRSAGDLADDLERVLESRPVRARAVGWAGRTLKRARRKPVHAALAAALVLGIPTVSVVGYWAIRQTEAVRQQQVESLVDLLNALAASGRYPEIADHAEELLRLDPDHPVGLRNRAVAAFNLARYEDDGEEKDRRRATAFEAVERWIEVQPDRAGPRMLEAHFLRQVGRTAEAERIERGIPEDADPDEDSKYFEALLAFEQRDLSRAEKLLSEVLLERTRPDALQARADVRLRLGKLDDAERDIRTLGALDPDNASVAGGLGLVELLRGNHGEAELRLRRAAELGGRDEWVYETLSRNALEWAQQLRLQGRGEQALEKLDLAERYARDGLELDTDGSAAWLPINLGLTLVERHRWTGRTDTALLKEATGYYARASEAPGRTRPVALSNQCDLLIEMRDLDAATKVCNGYVALKPSDPDGYYNLAGIHALAGRPEQALSALEKDLALGDTDWLYLESDPWFTSLRDRPEFRDLLERMRERAGSGES